MSTLEVSLECVYDGVGVGHDFKCGWITDGFKVRLVFGFRIYTNCCLDVVVVRIWAFFIGQFIFYVWSS